MNSTSFPHYILEWQLFTVCQRSTKALHLSRVDPLFRVWIISKQWILRPFVEALPSYVKDTTDLIQRLDGITIEDEWWLASIDVEALHTSIPHDLGLESIAYFLTTRGRQYLAHGQFVVDLLRFKLTQN